VGRDLAHGFGGNVMDGDSSMLDLPPPLRLDLGGVIRVGESRISVDLIVQQHENGQTPEQIIHAYDTLCLADVRAVLAYYEEHRSEMRAYLERRADEADSLQKVIEGLHPGDAYRVLRDPRSAH
jgi:uncharacterized protein (DUF433 family)